MRSQTFALPIDAMSLLLMMQMHASMVKMFFFKHTHTQQFVCTVKTSRAIVFIQFTHDMHAEQIRGMCVWLSIAAGLANYYSNNLSS